MLDADLMSFNHRRSAMDNECTTRIVKLLELFRPHLMGLGDEKMYKLREAPGDGTGKRSWCLAVNQDVWLSQPGILFRSPSEQLDERTLGALSNTASIGLLEDLKGCLRKLIVHKRKQLRGALANLDDLEEDLEDA